MFTIALTGGIGSGKTAVTEIFQQLAHLKSSASTSPFKKQQCLEIIDADIIARDLLSGSLNEKPSLALQEVYDLFGSELFDSHGQLRRTKLRSIVFSSEAKKHQLESLLHPLVYKEIFYRIEQLKKQKINIAIIAVPLLFETRAEHKFDRILVIDLPVELQIKRAALRDNSPAEQIKRIIHAQVDRQFRLKHADDIIDNSGNLSELQRQVAQLLEFYFSLEK